MSVLWCLAARVLCTNGCKNPFPFIEPTRRLRLKKMGMTTAVRGFMEAVNFVCSLQFWRMAVLWTISLVASYLQLFSRRFFDGGSCRYSHCVPPRIGSNSNRPICIITGATSGLGAAAAHALSRKGFCVVLVGRSAQLLSKTMKEIGKSNKDAHLKSFEVDLSTFQSILKFRSSLEKWLLDSGMHSSIQLLINNAGILATSQRITAEGYDQMMSANYIGAFCLTKHLLPLLKSSPVGSRIVNITSFTHRTVSEIQINERTVTGQYFIGSKQYPYARIYENSKLCLLLFTYWLHQQLYSMDKPCNVSVIAADPGAVKTNIMREVPSCLSQLAFTVLKLLGLLQHPENGISSILDAALGPREISGVYFFGGKGRTINSSPLSREIKLAEKLWTISSNIFLELELAQVGTPTSA